MAGSDFCIGRAAQCCCLIFRLTGKAPESWLTPRLGRKGETEAEDRAFARLAFQDDGAFVGVHDFLDGKHFQAALLAVGAAVGKGLKQAVERRLAHAGSIVGNGKAEVRRTAQLRAPPERFPVQLTQGQLKLDAAPALRHAVPAVGAEIYDGLLNLGRIGENGGEFPVWIINNLQPGGNDRADELGGFSNDRRQLDHVPFDGGALAKGLDLVDQFAGPVAGGENLLEKFMAALMRLVLQFHFNELGAAQDSSNDVVEIVGNPASHDIDGSGLVQLERFEFALAAGAFFRGVQGDVCDATFQPLELTVFITDTLSLFPNGEPMAPGVAEAVFDLERIVRSEACGNLPPDAGAVGFPDQTRKIEGGRGGNGKINAQQTCGGRADEVQRSFRQEGAAIEKEGELGDEPCEIRAKLFLFSRFGRGRDGVGRVHLLQCQHIEIKGICTKIFNFRMVLRFSESDESPDKIVFSGDMCWQSGKQPFEQVLPVTRRRLAKQTHGGVPRAVFAVEHPAPFGFIGQ